MHIFEEVDEVEKHNEFVEELFAIVQPKAFKKYKDKRDLQRMEEGVDEVIYKGEDDWQEIMEEFKAFGFDNIDPFGERLKDAT